MKRSLAVRSQLLSAEVSALLRLHRALERRPRLRALVETYVEARDARRETDFQAERELVADRSV